MAEINPVSQIQIEALEKDLKAAFGDERMTEAETLATKLRGLDPENRLAAKVMDKIAKGKTDAVAKTAEKAKPAATGGLFSRLFKKTAPSAPAAAAAATPGPETPAPAPAGNMFTGVFGKKEENIIDTILASTGSTEKTMAVEIKDQVEHHTAKGFLSFSKLFMQFSVVAILLSAGFFYAVNIDTGNSVLSIFGVSSNYASLHASADAELADRVAQKDALEKDVNKFKQGYQSQYGTVIDGIVAKRLNWSKLLEKINAVVNSVYDHNELLHYVQFDSYSYDAKDAQVHLSGTLSDPQGKNLAKLLELQSAFENYPRDPSNPNDTTKPYFSNVNKFNSLSKSTDKKTGVTMSSLQFSFNVNEDATTPAAPAPATAPAPAASN